jgi:hypothetical protein
MAATKPELLITQLADKIAIWNSNGYPQVFGVQQRNANIANTVGIRGGKFKMAATKLLVWPPS